MKKIVLFCANGFTTAMMSKKLEEAIAKAGADYTSNAYPYAEIKEHAKEADIILLGPQIRYNFKHVQADYPDKPVILLDMRTYAAMDGETIFKQVQEVLDKK